MNTTICTNNVIFGLPIIQEVNSFYIVCSKLLISITLRQNHDSKLNYRQHVVQQNLKDFFVSQQFFRRSTVANLLS